MRKKREMRRGLKRRGVKRNHWMKAIKQLRKRTSSKKPYPSLQYSQKNVLRKKRTSKIKRMIRNQKRSKFLRLKDLRRKMKKRKTTEIKQLSSRKRL